MTLNDVQQRNQHLEIIDINNERFRAYGRVLEGYDLSEIEQFAKSHIQVPETGSAYIVSIPEIEQMSVVQKIFDDIYAGMAAQAGVCTGQNKSLTGIEFHQGSETLIALTDCVLILGKKQDIFNDTYDSALTECFFVRERQIVELYDTTLHYAPCNTADYFMTIVILLKGTNEPLEKAHGQITKKNKWFITHPSVKTKVEAGCIPGLIGEIKHIY